MSKTTVHLKTINKKIVKVPKVLKKKEKRALLGEEIFPEPYPNIFICAKKKSGKTVVIYNTVKARVGPNTSVIAFCSTVNKDPVWLEIKKWCAEHKVPYHGFESIKKGKIDLLDRFAKQVEIEAKEKLKEEEEYSSSEEEDSIPQFRKPRVGQSLIKKKKPMKIFSDDENSADEDFMDDYPSEESEDENPRYATIPECKAIFSRRNHMDGRVAPVLAPDYLMIFDDISNEIKLPSVATWVKKNRHFKTMNILCSQYANDLAPQQLKQMDGLFLFKSLDRKKLEKLRIDTDLGISEDVLWKLYKDATSEPYNFLWCNAREDTCRKNFDKQYIIEKKGDDTDEDSD